MTKKVEEKAYNNSVHVGEEKERIETTLTVNRVFPKETNFGVTYIYHMNDPNGNYFVWFASTAALEVGETYDVKATVKQHSEFNGVKQTVVTRVKPINNKVKI